MIHKLTNSGKLSPDPLMLRWLEPGEHDGELIGLASYPRSGNTLLRDLLQKVTGIHTGADTDPSKSLSKDLLNRGLKGEGVVDDSVWFVKTHYPERLGYKPFKMKKAIVVVRNPWDAIDSYFNMTLTNTHNKSLHESQYERFSERWDAMLRNEIDIWMRFHRFWTSKVEIPVLFVRYEDLLVHRAEMLRRVLLFLTDSQTLANSEWEERIATVCGDTDGHKTYEPRIGKIGAAFSHYSETQFQYILQTAKIPLRGFGYDPEKQDFPNRITLPRRHMKPGKALHSELETSLDFKMQLRDRKDMFGSAASRFRKRLTEPVIASDGSELNLHELEKAREYMKKSEQHS